MSTTNFTGLTMPVFTAFGWAGEETAIKFAFTQLEAFIGALHVNLPRTVQMELSRLRVEPGDARRLFGRE